MPGTVVFRPIEANLVRDTDLVGRMNPYCSVSIGRNRMNGQICKKGGKHPHWMDSISVPVYGYEPTALIEVMDKDKVTRDDNIGSCTINLQELQSIGKLNKWYPLYHGNKKAGDILLEATWQDGVIQPDSLGSLQQEQNLYGQQGLAGAGLYQSGSNLGQQNFSQQNQSQRSLYDNTLISQQQSIYGKQNLYGSQYNTAQFGGQYVDQRQDQYMGEHQRYYTEQHSSVQPHTFIKNVPVTEIAPVMKQVEVYEERRVVKDVPYTEIVPVKKCIDVMEPVVVMREIEVMEPVLVNKEIQVIENVPVKKFVDVVEMRNELREIETYEPQTFKTQVEVTEQVPVKKVVAVEEPVTVNKAVEFVEPIIKTETITKEVREPVIINEKITKEIGPATLVGVDTSIKERQLVNQFSTMTVTERERRLEEERLFEERRLLQERQFETHSNEEILKRNKGQETHFTNKQEDFLRDRISGFRSNRNAKKWGEY